jgi:hypothetical protein
MHQFAPDDRYREALRRLAVILLSLAQLAEDLAHRSWPFRSLVLWLLNKAEIRVRGVAARAGAGALPFEYPACPPVGATDAARLAKSLRALAVVFFALSRQGPQWLWKGGRRCRLRDVMLFCRQAPAKPCYADTS